MGEVWLAHDTVLERDVAVKILSAELAKGDDSTIAEFIEGAKVAASRGHAGLNKVFSADVSQGTPYLVLEFLDGPNLQEVLAQSGRLELPAARAIIEAVSDAVAELHHHDLVHRDLKPSNIVLTRDGRVIVTDFGLACVLPAAALRGSSVAVAGTPAYMAPEMFDGVVSARTDVYAIGMTAYYLLCGRPAFQGTLEELKRLHQGAEIDTEPLRVAGVPEVVIDVVVRATSRKVLFRPKTARHVLDAFRLAFDAARIECASPASLTRILQLPAAASQELEQSGAESKRSMPETLSEFATRRRQVREGEPVLSRSGPAPVKSIDPGYLRRRRTERQRIWIGGTIAAAVGGCAAIAAVLLFIHIWWQWEHWVEVTLAHSSGIGKTASAFSIAGMAPGWARLLVMGVPIGTFIMVPVFVSTLIYRLIRGKPLPANTEHTLCGWCQHELRGISTPVCAECGHRIGDTGPDEQGLLPVGRRQPRRLAARGSLPLFFVIATLIAALLVALVVRLSLGKLGVVGFGGGRLNVMPIAVFPGLALTLAFYEGFLQFELRHSGRAWCRICKGELRDLATPACPHCGEAI